MPYEFIESPNCSGRNGNQVSGLIAHFTAAGSMNDTVRYMCNKIRAPEGKSGKGFIIINGITYYDAKAAAHYITDRDGRTVQLVRENMAAWHAGSSTTKPKLNGKGNLNLWTIGHEICNWGALRKDGEKYYCWPNNWTQPYTGPEPIYFLKDCKEVASAYLFKDGRKVFPTGMIEYWEPYTEEQIISIITLWSEIVTRYGITREWIAGHDAVDPTRKIDPGPMFPWDEIFDEIYKDKQKSDMLHPDLPKQTSDIVKHQTLEDQLAIRQFNDDRSKECGVLNTLTKIFLK
jgi:N-acetyl-anhydromuramyl-L-alanine amidase AmpD